MEKLISEIRDLIRSPGSTFERLKATETSQSEITKNMLIYLAAIPAVAGFLGRVVIGYNTAFYTGYARVSFFSGLISAILMFVLTIIGVYVISYIVNGLAVNFGGEKSELNAFKLTVYSFIPVLVLGVFSLVPSLSGLYILGLYGVYVFYVGAPILMQVKEDKVLTYTVIISLISIVITILFDRIAKLVIVTKMPSL